MTQLLKRINFYFKIFAHSACNSAPNLEPLASNRAHKAQISAQSRHSKIHALFPDSIQSVMHISQLVTQDKQASIQFLEFSMAYFFKIR